ncbi:MAG: hypothetical protein ACI97A_000367 [Planctomycetota bacterium]
MIISDRKPKPNMATGELNHRNSSGVLKGCFSGKVKIGSDVYDIQDPNVMNGAAVGEHRDPYLKGGLSQEKFNGTLEDEIKVSLVLIAGRSKGIEWLRHDGLALLSP